MFVQDGYFFFSKMPVNLNQYRAAIGVFNNRHFMTGQKHYYFSETSNMRNNFLFNSAINVMVLVFMFKDIFNPKKIGNIGLDWLLYLFISRFFIQLLVIYPVNQISGDPEENPGPKYYSGQYLIIYYWNLNSIEAHNIIKVQKQLKKGAFRNLAKFTGNHLCQSLFFNKVAGLRPFSQYTSGRLLLKVAILKAYLSVH